MPTLTIDQLTHVYPNGVKALDAVSLDIPQGLYGLLGPNGAGKSTLMRTVATLQAPTSGSVRFDGIDVLAEPQMLRRKLGYLPQDFGVYPRVSALEMLDHLATLKGLANAKSRRTTVEHLLNQANLWAVRHKALSGFSGGMRQRFGIAQALIGDPASTRRNACGFSICWPRSARMSSSSSRPTSSLTCRTSVHAWRSSWTAASCAKVNRRR
jgi:ABC-2 type transport system ATP-binding protein